MSNEKTKLVPKLRFPEFRGAEGWGTEKVDTLVETVTPPQKLPTSMYAASGTFPIIDQSQSYICGWTDDKESLIQQGLPLIVFGDHTCILKLIDRPFAQGADGIKILKARPTVLATYLYQFLGYRPVITEEYKRHFSTLKEKAVFFPNVKTGEQQKIAECLSSADELIAAQARKVDALKTHKKGLMQQLFPREGETQPRLRFPEFRDTGEWEPRKLGSLFEIGGGRDYKHLASGEIPVYGSGGYMLSVDKFLHDGESVCIGRKGTIDRPMYLSGKFWTVDTLFFTHSFKDTIPKFVFSIFENIEWKNHNEAGGVPSLSKTIIEKIETAIPSISEQQRIADCLTSMDTLITTATHALDTLKTHKKGLMQQLFPAAATELI